MNSTVSESPRPHLTIRPSAGWIALNLAEVWRFRDLLLTLAGRDVKLRYRQTALGAIWVVLQPLMAAGIFSFVFGRVAKLSSDGLPYFLFSYAGLLGWNAFNSTLSKSSTCLIQNSQLIAKVFFPRLVLPLSTIFSSLIDFGVGLSLMLVMLPLYHIYPGWSVLLLPVWLSLLLMLAAGFGLYAAALTVTYRDVQYVVPVLLQFLLYASPIAYSISKMPHQLQAFYFWNPLYGLIEAFRWSLLGRGDPHWGAVAYAATVSVVVFLWGALMFKQMERKFADVI